MCLNSDAHFGVNTTQERDVPTCPHPRGGVRPIDALRSSRQQLPREDVTVHVRGAVVVRAVKKRSTLVVALLVLVFYGANATENITLLRTLASPGGTGVVI